MHTKQPYSTATTWQKPALAPHRPSKAHVYIQGQRTFLRWRDNVSIPNPKKYDNGITLARSNKGMLKIICKYTNRGVCVINGNLTFSVELWEKLLKLGVGETYHPLPPPLVALHTNTHTCARATNLLSGSCSLIFEQNPWNELFLVYFKPHADRRRHTFNALEDFKKFEPH